MQKICVLIACNKPIKRYLWESISSIELASFCGNVEIDIFIGFNGDAAMEMLAMIDLLKKRCKRCKSKFLLYLEQELQTLLIL